MNTKHSFSLRQRIKWLLVSCFVPLTIMIIYLLLQIFFVSERYDKTVQNITKANEYNISFREDLDYSMYIVVVNAERAEELLTVDPNTLLKDAEDAFTDLYDKTTEKDEKTQLKQILTNLKTLDKHVKEIQADAQIVGLYDKNMERLDLDIRIMTELFQEQVQQYINSEASVLETLRIKIRTQVMQMITVSLVALILLFSIALTLSRRISKSVTHGIEQLQTVTKKAGEGDFSARASLDHSDEELADLGNGFNQMVEQIGNLVEDIRVEQMNLRFAEQKLLQAQINPHFLYNTLDAIIWQAEAGEKDQLITMVTALSDFFRTTLSKGRDHISVQEEEAHIRSYLQIQQIRYQDILQYEIEIPEEMYQYQILKLTIQPLVENALYHGIKNKRGVGMIRVVGSIDHQKMYFSVYDNGIGMTTEQLSKIRDEISCSNDMEEPSGFGLYNVAQRLRLYYGPEFAMEVESEYGKGTVFTVSIPCILQDSSHQIYEEVIKS